jgi:tetratricopeptide (TPR) repeat protein
LKKYSEALNRYLETVKTDPTHGSAYNNLANLYYMARKYQQALFYLQKAESCGAKINPRFKQTLYKAMRK